MINQDLVKRLQCPISGKALTLSQDGSFLLSEAAACRFPIKNGIALLLPDYAQPLSVENNEASLQQESLETVKSNSGHKNPTMER